MKPKRVRIKLGFYLNQEAHGDVIGELVTPPPNTSDFLLSIYPHFVKLPPNQFRDSTVLAFQTEEIEFLED